MKDKNSSGWIGGLIIGAVFGGLLWLERRRPLRRGVESKLKRSGRNLAMAAISGLALQITEQPASARLTSLVERRGWGLLKIVRLPRWLEVLLAVAMLDYTLYYWHMLAHRAPWLWRFHRVHHADADLDVTTALRFHFGELVMSVGWRAGQILIIGVSPLALSIWQTALLVSVMFHHSNVRMPAEVERRLNRFIVTPRMHAIHHSVLEEETNSNWSSGLTIWDQLHGTLNLNRYDEEIIIGVPGQIDVKEATIGSIIKLPFLKEESI